MTPDIRPKFRIGLLLNGTSISKYVFDFIKWILADDHLELKSIIIRSPSSATVGFPDACQDDCDYRPTPVAGFLFTLIVMFERLLLLKNRDHHDHMQKFDLLLLVPHGIIRAESLDDSPRDGPPDVDLLVVFSSGPLSKGVWESAKLGVIALSLSDRRNYRGGPPGFWEVYFRDDVTGFTIERLRSAPQENETLFRGQIATQYYYLLNQASLFQKSTYYLAQLVGRIAASGKLPTRQEELPFSRIPQHNPELHHTLHYALGLIGLLISKILQKLGRDYRWKVAFLPCEWRVAALWRASIIPNKPGHYLADPFIITQDGRHFCFAEDYDIAQRRGRIVVYELKDRQAAYVGIAIQEDFHLSYPFLFYYDGVLYMCPETSAVREIRIYRCLEFPLRWTLDKVLMTGVSAADSMLFERDGRWWMLTNIDPADWGDHAIELHVFSATNPVSDKWTPHPGNPFFIDAAFARNGGMVREGDRLFRVAQSQGFGMYGKRTTLREIVELTDQQYVERQICVISPQFRRRIFGTHHFHSDGAVTVFDFA